MKEEKHESLDSNPSITNTPIFLVENFTAFEESKIWELNRSYYQENGIEAWSSGVVPHHLTCNSKVGKTYAELIFGFLNDLSRQGNSTDPVYILELGAGQGRLAFHLLKHLEELTKQSTRDLPPYCYVLSDIVEDNLSFFEDHPQFQPFFQSGVLDVCYYDILKTDSLVLRKKGIEIQENELSQPLFAIANYFFDSIPTSLYSFQKGERLKWDISIQSDIDPELAQIDQQISGLSLQYKPSRIQNKISQENFIYEILEEYKKQVFNTFLLIPEAGIEGIRRLRTLSQKGMFLVSMDKGNHEIHDLENSPAPEVMKHGSLSFSVNFHAFQQYCKKSNGESWFPSSTFHLDVACLMFLENASDYKETKLAFSRYVDDFGPDDLNILKRQSYALLNESSLQEIIMTLRAGAYDSKLFINFLPRIKQLIQTITFNERFRVSQTMDKVWDKYFTIYEADDLAFEIGGIYYALGFYEKALQYFERSENLFGVTTDVYYNRILAYYQLRKDEMFVSTLTAAKSKFPDFENFKELEKLDLNAE